MYVIIQIYLFSSIARDVRTRCKFYPIKNKLTFYIACVKLFKKHIPVEHNLASRTIYIIVRRYENNSDKCPWSLPIGEFT